MWGLFCGIPIDVKRTQKIGVDLVEVARFKPFAKNPKHHFIKKVFTEEEVGYCMRDADSAVSLAGTFAAKEAASKALGVERCPFIGLEIRRTDNGAPEVWRKGRKLSVQISITHTSKFVVAVALV